MLFLPREVKLLLSLPQGSKFNVISKKFSMLPVIKPGDVLDVEKISYRNIKIYDIIAFYTDNPPFLIAHRVIKKKNIDSNINIFLTKGDNNNDQDKWLVDEKHYIGKVILPKRNLKKDIIKFFKKWLKMFYLNTYITLLLL